GRGLVAQEGDELGGDLAAVLVPPRRLPPAAGELDHVVDVGLVGDAVVVEEGDQVGLGDTDRAGLDPDDLRDRPVEGVRHLLLGEADVLADPAQLSPQPTLENRWAGLLAHGDRSLLTAADLPCGTKVAAVLTGLIRRSGKLLHTAVDSRGFVCSMRERR